MTPLATDLLGSIVCFRLPPKRRGEEPHTLHKTRGCIRVVYVDDNSYLKFAVVSKLTNKIEVLDRHQMVICDDITFEDAVKQLDAEDEAR
jgi:hypothetical protein